MSRDLIVDAVVCERSEKVWAGDRLGCCDQVISCMSRYLFVVGNAEVVTKWPTSLGPVLRHFSCFFV
jgi:hypothetical protein